MIRIHHTQHKLAAKLGYKLLINDAGGVAVQNADGNVVIDIDTAAGLKQFGSSKSEAYEAAFKTETVGLVTREEFMQKRNTIAQRIEEEEAQARAVAEAAAAAEREKRKRDKAKAKLKAKLSFLGDVSALGTARQLPAVFEGPCNGGLRL